MKHFAKNFLNAVSPNLGRTIRNLKLQKLLKSQPQIASDGTKYWGAQQYENYEPDIFKALFGLMLKSKVFVNVGANHGIYCLKMARMAEAVFAFEALPYNLHLLMKNVKENHLSQSTVVFPVAVGAEQSLVTFYGASTGGSLLKGWNQQVDDGITIPLFSLDYLLYEKLVGTSPLFLIDVEGAELGVVKGARKIAENIDSAIFCIEIPCREFMPDETFNPNFLEIFGYFFSIGYRSWQIDEGGSLVELNPSIVRSYFDANRYEGIMAVFSKNDV